MRAMGFLTVPSILQLLCLGIAGFAAYQLHWEMTIGRHRRDKFRKHGCKPIPRVSISNWFWGVDMYFKTLKWAKEHTLLENLDKLLFPRGRRTVTFTYLHHSVIFTTEAENIQAAKSLNFRDFGLPDRSKEIDTLLGQGIFTNEGQEWHRSRELLRPCFSRSQVADLDMLEGHARRLMDGVPYDGSTIDLAKPFSIYTLYVTIDFLFGDGSGKALTDADGFNHNQFLVVWDRIAEFLAEGGQSIEAMFFCGFSWYRSAIDNAQYERDCQKMHGYIDRLVEESLSTKLQSRYLFLQAFISQKTDKLRMRDEALGLLFAGRDTTAALLTNVFFQLAKNPEVSRRLKAEIDTLHGRKPTYEQLKGFKYLRAVLNESQRLCPVTPAIPVQAKEDAVLPLGGGEDGRSSILVKKSQIVVVATYSMHRREDLYGSDADIFRPERWLDVGDQKGLRTSWEYLPFSGGPRICIGQNFAITEASYLVIRLLQELGCPENRDPMPWCEDVRFVCGSFGGCKIAFPPRAEGYLGNRAWIGSGPENPRVEEDGRSFVDL